MHLHHIFVKVNFIMVIDDALKRLMSAQYMLKPEQKMQDTYDTKQIYKTFLKVAWPATFESVLISLVSFIDAVMVGTVGKSAIAEVGITGQPRMIFYAVFFALNVGVTAIVSRRFGEKNKEGANKCLAQALGICIVIGIIMCSVALKYSEPLLRFAGAKDDTIDGAKSYFDITMVGLLFTSVGMIINAAQRGCGNTKISMRTNLTANGVNIVFNYLLINGIGFFPTLGVTGAAIATLLGNIVSCGMSIYSISNKNKFLHLKPRDLICWYPEYISLIFKISSSAAIEQLFIRIGFFFYTKMVAELGTDDFTTHQICMQIINLSFAFGDGLGIAASSLVGQNLGKKRPDYSIIYGKTGQRVGVLISVGMFILFTAGGNMLMSMFTQEAHIIDMGVKLLVIVAFSSPAQIYQVIYSGCLRGAGDTKYVAFTSLISIAIIRPTITYIICYPLGFGLIGAWISLLIDQYTRFLFSSIRFRNGKWCKIVV